MTRIDFIALCGEYLIDPGVALENQSLRDALADKNDKLVKELFETEF